MRSIYDNAVVKGYAIVKASSNGVIAYGPSVDTKGYNTAALRVFLSEVGSGLSVAGGSSLSAVLQESTDDSTFTDATDNSGATIGFTGTQATTTAVLSDARIEGLGLNRDRYLRVKLTGYLGGTAAANVFTAAAVIELARAFTDPVTETVSNT